ncbi:hydrogenase maturation protease [candidate division WOR-3 bacterium]|nr:hydrogenase maturation protease [candidate division WOR-3 bacterium]
MTVLLCGMGNIERGDDGFGPYVVQHLGTLKKMKTLDCGMHIENYLNTIIRMAPDLVLLLDTVENIPTQTVLLRNEEILKSQPLSLTTHVLPFSSMYEYIKDQCGAEVWLLGAAPQSYEHFSDPVRLLAQKVIRWSEFLDSEKEIDIINVYETLSSTLR